MPYKDVTPSDIFKCRQCGECCKGYGGTFVNEKEIKVIADYLNTDPDSFVDDYCQASGGKPVLAQGRNSYCVFWDGLCKIHPVKPRMCRNWPFIKSVLVDIKNWHIMSELCPGIRTDLPDNVIKECVRKELKKNL
ncbi:MAG: YkgJ family cysteine cluster protein [Deltaproteobacteria bacterium]|nr:YkgJ family cysteine cluster protein [Deltaproteobacteria bacterium]MBW1957182.1 YkgJ family cysteine cluster protein [Deltaproteobacteria bacterium]MBW2012388.1 YkgJ family cysteine cluster protein [Deltaproteobacteria bacterium]MBW2087838.1 YkgJ family cysteine cluster protein [Deltaproteobacteria bacterium]MBW2319527.1 YkgJ family cysteine cluster protein [Deltaproteobacteria bacterium]